MKKKSITSIIVEIFRLNSELAAWGDNFTRLHGLTSSKWKTISALATKNGPATINWITREMGLSRQGALKNINALITSGFVQAEKNSLHKTAKLYKLTDKGRRVHQELELQWQIYLARISDNFSESELKLTLKSIEKIREHIK